MVSALFDIGKVEKGRRVKKAVLWVLALGGSLAACLSVARPFFLSELVQIELTC